ncbi:Zn-dependent protease [Saccharopolyspora erythraea NRRL 2338]|uniref:Zinc metalloprotease n=3 Tax=Saccharopolyspora erythraea TaxID=1836 RepID=A4FD21_SACEN|nr:site-2 protease family protein [Saccharopolyspora erythraea]EQD83343.1 peptidase M50 [Saccharopolyspora erythraea D]PFG95694.1 Zn-dependent protease [Saccharopolyspora erythraea NRRL 2338]QRK92289.1 site-2 protease family protein [Saccharopolyspora erythraea]CAM01946.1 peptidase M50 [Saccharopolyspora erythraea NRRL 2338]
MHGTIPPGRIAGVRVGLHWSVAGIVVVVAAGLAAYQLPAVYPGHSRIAYAVAGVAASGLLVCSLLGHELAHAVVARRNGVAVEGITLWLLGGVARLRDEARSPGADLRIATVGPTASAALAVAFGALAWTSNLAGAGELVIAVLGYLALLNVLLALFNLLPAAPLDGGRVLRAALWRWRGDRHRAALWSARAGLGLSYLLVIGGIVQLVIQSTGGLWWVLLGMFIAAAAIAEERRARASAALAGIRVRDVMSPHVDAVDADLTVEQFLRADATPGGHAVRPVLGPAGRVEGVITVRDVNAIPEQERPTSTLSDVAWPLERIATAAPEEALTALLPRLDEAAEGHVLVFAEHDRLGIVSPSDISRTVAERGLHVSVPGASTTGAERTPPPSNWWYPGQRRR